MLDLLSVFQPVDNNSDKDLSEQEDNGCKFPVKENYEAYFVSWIFKSKFWVWYGVLYSFSMATDKLNFIPSTLRYFGLILSSLLLLMGILWALIYIAIEIHIIFTICKIFYLNHIRSWIKKNN